MAENRSSDDILHEARRALQSGEIEVEAVVERYAPPLAEAGRIEELGSLLQPRHRRLLREWKRANDHSTETGPDIVRLSDVEPETVEWLWPKRVPLDKLTLLEGDPEELKSTLTLDLAAQISRGGRLPDGTASDLDGPAGTVLLTAEDGLADTIRPRLNAANADADRVAALQGVGAEEERLPTVEDVDAIEEAVRRVDAALVVVDPLVAYLGADVNSWRDQDVRRALRELANLAERMDVAVVAIRHLNKSGGGKAKYRGGGSIGIIAAARSAMLVAPDPDDPDGNRRVLATIKSNLAERPPALAFRPEEAANGAVRISWEGEADRRADELLGNTESAEERTEREVAASVLRQELRDGPVEVEELKDVADTLEISWRTFRRAKQQLGIEHTRDGFNGPWMYRAPKSAKEDWPTSNTASMADNGNGSTSQGDSASSPADIGQNKIVAENGSESEEARFS